MDRDIDEYGDNIDYSDRDNQIVGYITDKLIESYLEGFNDGYNALVHNHTILVVNEDKGTNAKVEPLNCDVTKIHDNAKRLYEGYIKKLMLKGTKSKWNKK